MKVYLVRVKANKEAVGIYWGTTEDILESIDEVCNPKGLEYKVLKAGGVEFAFEDAPSLPIIEEEGEEGDVHDALWKGASASEWLFQDLQSDEGWRDLDKVVAKSEFLDYDQLIADAILDSVEIQGTA